MEARSSAGGRERGRKREDTKRRGIIERVEMEIKRDILYKTERRDRGRGERERSVESVFIQRVLLLSDKLRVCQAYTFKCK